MRIALVGTSNCILSEGISAALAANPAVTGFGNFSLGASPSVHIARSTAGVDFSQYDFCLIDFAVNEDVLLRNGAISPEHIHIQIDALAARCLQAGCLPVILIFPKPMRPELSKGRAFYLDYAQKLHLPYLNGFEVVEYLTRQQGLTTEQIFQDKSHVSRWVGRFFGDMVVDSLTRLETTKAERIPGQLSAGMLDQICLITADTPPEIQVFRQSSLIKDTFRILHLGTPLEIDLPDPQSQILGICINQNQTSCLLAVEGENTCLIDLQNLYFEHPRFKHLLISILPLLHPVSPRDGKINLRLVTPEEVGEGPVPLRGVLGKPSQPELKNVLEISRVVIRKSESITLQEIPAPSLHVNLFATCPEEQRVTLFQKHRPIPVAPEEVASPAKL